MDDFKIEIDKEKVKILERTIVEEENKNLKTHKKTYQEMVKWIKEEIERLVEWL